jgi:hypothetical protein
MTSTTDVLDLMQEKLEAVLRQHNATADHRKMRLIWGEGQWEVELREKQHDGTETEIREALLTFAGEDLEVHLGIGRPDRPGWLTISKYLEEFKPLSLDPEEAACVMRDACFPMVKVDLLPGASDTEGRLVAVGVSTSVFVEGLTARTLVTLLEDLLASALDVEERL